MWKTIRHKKQEMNIFMIKQDSRYEITYPINNPLFKIHASNMIKKGYKIKEKHKVLHSVRIIFMRS